MAMSPSLQPVGLFTNMLVVAMCVVRRPSCIVTNVTKEDRSLSVAHTILLILKVVWFLGSLSSDTKSSETNFTSEVILFSLVE